MYAKFKNKFYKVVKSKEVVVNRITYAIMIYENYKNPVFYRKFIGIVNRFVNKDIKYGVMQVESEREIDDEKSIKLALTKLEKSFIKLDKKKTDIEKVTLLLEEKYSDKEYIKDIIDIYNEIVEFENR